MDVLSQSQSIIVFFFYGLAFFIMGFSILIYPKKESKFKLSKSLFYLGVFGILHGFNEWIDMFLVINKPGKIFFLEVVKIVILPVSFFFLFQFGIRTILDSKKGYSENLKYVPSVLFLTWGVIVSFSNQRLLIGDIMARYLLGFPGIILTTYGLVLQSSKFRDIHIVSKNLISAAFGFFFYSLFSGLTVPNAGFFPASFFNYTVFIHVFVFPVQLYRTVLALIISYNIIQVLAVFEWETKELLVEANKGLEKRVDERTEELNLKIDEFEKWFKVTQNRELKMVELKKEIKDLKDKLDTEKNEKMGVA